MPLDVKLKRRSAFSAISKAEVTIEFASKALPVSLNAYRLMSLQKKTPIKNSTIERIGDSIIRLENTIGLLKSAMERYKSSSDLNILELYIEVLKIETDLTNELFNLKMNEYTD